MHRDPVCLAFLEDMFITNSVDKRIELKMDVDIAAKKVLKKHRKSIDDRKSLKNKDEIDIFTSKHIYGATKITRYAKEWIKEGKINVSPGGPKKVMIRSIRPNVEHIIPLDSDRM